MQPRFWVLSVSWLFIIVNKLGGLTKYRSRVKKPIDIKLYAYIIIFLFYMLASALWSPNFNHSIPKALDILFIFLIIGIYRYFQKLFGQMKYFEAFWTGIFLVTTMLSLITIATGLLSQVARTNALGGGPNVFGRIMGLLCIAALYFVFQKQQRWAFIFFIVGSILVIVSGSRGAFFATIIGCSTLVIISRLRWQKMFLIVIIGGSIIAIFMLKTSIGRRALETFQQRVLQLTIMERYDAGRSVIYAKAIEIGKKSPIVGNGLDGFYMLTGDPYPHNVFLEIFAEGGIIGLTLFIMILSSLVRIIWKHRKNLQPASMAAFVLILFACQFSGDLYDSRGLFLFPFLIIKGKEEIVAIGIV